MTLRGVVGVGLALFGLAGGSVACEGGPTNDSRALVVTSAKPTPEPAATAGGTTVVDDSGGAADAGSATTPPPPPPPPPPPATTVDDGYEAMCRHYCATLQLTDLYACIGRGGGESDCATTVAGYAGQCYDLRCAPRLVRPPLCLVQCDSLARFYELVCAGVAPAAGSLCPSSPADHDAACRAGCPPPGTP